MKKLSTFTLVLTIVAISALCPSLIAQTRSKPHRLSFDGFGPVKVGMTAAQASKALGVTVAREAGYDGNQCYYAAPKRGKGFNDVSFMMSKGKIVRIDVHNKTFATDLGAKIGDTEARVKRLYKGRYKVSPHKYTDGHYIEVDMKRGKYSIVFETDGKRITNFRSGKSEEAHYVEGCS